MTDSLDAGYRAIRQELLAYLGAKAADERARNLTQALQGATWAEQHATCVDVLSGALSGRAATLRAADDCWRAWVAAEAGSNLERFGGLIGTGLTADRASAWLRARGYTVPFTGREVQA